VKITRRKIPLWIPNIILGSILLLTYVLLTCRITALGYRIASISKRYEELKSWNQYYKSRILSESASGRIQTKAKALNLSLEIPQNWAVREIVHVERSQPSHGKVEAATR